MTRAVKLAALALAVPVVLSACQAARPEAKGTTMPNDTPSASAPASRDPAADAALLAAARTGDADAVRTALDRGARVDTRDTHRRTALVVAANGDHVAAARVLVAAGADPDAQDDRRDSAFLVTGVTGSVAMLDALLPAHPDTTVTNRYGGVAVIPASERGHADYVEAVLTRTDIDVNHVNDLGWTALLEAVVLGDGGAAHQRVVRSLVAHGADVNLADRDGVTPLRHAVDRGQDEVADVLRAAGAR
ncbi:MAG TPA: ankyrin repeat domain-containing protein [Actinocatenispora sp.]